MNTLSGLTAQPRPLVVAGKTYQVYPLMLEELGQLQAWIDAQFPDPFSVVGDAIRRGDYTVAQQQFLMQEALNRATRPKRLIGTAEADQLLQTVEGIKQLLVLAIRKGDPSFGDDEARHVWAHMRLGDLEALFCATGLDGVMSDPKGSGSMPSGNGSSTSPRHRKRASTGGGCTTKR